MDSGGRRGTIFGDSELSDVFLCADDAMIATERDERTVFGLHTHASNDVDGNSRLRMPRRKPGMGHHERDNSKR